MQVFVHFDGELLSLNVDNLPTKVLDVKGIIDHQTGIPVRDQSLFDYPQSPDQGPGLRLLADNHIFYPNMLNKEVQLVLTHGRVCSVVYFYVRYLIPVNSPKKVVKFSAHRFATIGDLKVRIAGKTGLQANSIQLYHNPSYPLDNNLNIYECGVQNGSSLFCALPQ